MSFMVINSANVSVSLLAFSKSILIIFQNPLINGHVTTASPPEMWTRQQEISQRGSV